MNNFHISTWQLIVTCFLGEKVYPKKIIKKHRRLNKTRELCTTTRKLLSFFFLSPILNKYPACLSDAYFHENVHFNLNLSRATGPLFTVPYQALSAGCFTRPAHLHMSLNLPVFTCTETDRYERATISVGFFQIQQRSNDRTFIKFT